MNMERQVPLRENLIRNAQEVVASVREDGCNILGACIVSSLAAGDFTPASDVDMLMVATDKKGKQGIFRRLIGDRVFEWMVMPNDCLTNVDAILADAGLCHDILTAIILFDTDHWLEQVQREVALQYQSPQWTWKRTMGQLQRVAGAIGQMQRQLADGNILQVQRAHVSILKALFGVPRAILNKRCTMARGLLFCREAIDALGWPDYMSDALSAFGVSGISRETALSLEELAVQIIAATEFTQNERAIRICHLQSARWLMENAQPTDAVWPLYFWSSAAVEESGGDQNPVLWEYWQRFAAILGVSKKHDLLEKKEQAQRLYELGVGLVEAYKPQLGL